MNIKICSVHCQVFDEKKQRWNGVTSRIFNEIRAMEVDMEVHFVEEACGVCLIEAHQSLNLLIYRRTIYETSPSRSEDKKV